MTESTPVLSGLIPENMKVRSMRIVLDALEVQVDIGFHDYEVGAPQRLLITVECWLDELAPPADDDPAQAWDYDFVKSEVEAIAASRRFNLQETLAHEIFATLAPLHGLRALRVRTSKPDIYANTAGVGVEIASFSGLWPPH
jgi:dihydroneopterin aldolase